jgi:peroxiredoxin Q/BCP
MKGSAVTRRDAILGATATAVSLLANTGAARALDVGAAAPTVTLPATGGGTVALNDVVKANKYTVLYFYNQDFSSGCSIEAERFNQALGDFKAKGAEVVGVSMDSMVKHEEFCSAKDLRFKLLSDNDGAVSAAYGADLKIPILGKFSDRQTFLIDGAGTVKGHWLERDGSMANVKTPAHTSQILEAIDKL